MGNRASSQKQPEAGTADARNDDQSATEESGVYLSKDFQEKVLKDFQSKVLKEEWESRQRNIMIASNERIARDEQRKAELDQKLEVWKDHNTNVHAQLDSKVDSLKARFTDLEVELRYDVSRLESTSLGLGPKFGRGEACVSARADLAACLKETDDFMKCDRFIDILEHCTKKTVMSQ
mmetsp:Transcript_13694/g.28198  ORF Transcript_13694/g.28198 Transcript_13694/m.28198 type:complete len:178 (-) Transcript_13694:206-739(-)|eukprot:CAMPEP_0183308458 /NCGR_PEP_ID=MMETSP0160_2-20130417/22128_1 /TAXON_ID=2839 ORGANISM="Odontella Sinensis, Strain Grunow 1884" /NCGR_SAMPLE_ID=MMETSP0160_2 /ASSEMBLY_ACC=CAM_ASM_000250 /LENGTH=177 /DNA_ID=CAMNT_0025472301 /DNA_START=49 /DNA_END=582 /DNA_ORIENTATION=-